MKKLCWSWDGNYKGLNYKAAALPNHNDIINELSYVLWLIVNNDKLSVLVVIISTQYSFQTESNQFENDAFIILSIVFRYSKKENFN